jgi:hypothetical protein
MCVVMLYGDYWLTRIGEQIGYLDNRGACQS